MLITQRTGGNFNMLTLAEILRSVNLCLRKWTLYRDWNTNLLFWEWTFIFVKKLKICFGHSKIYISDPGLAVYWEQNSQNNWFEFVEVFLAQVIHPDWVMTMLACVWRCGCVCVCTCGLEDTRIALAVPGGKRLHHAIDLLGFTRKSETPQKLPATAENRNMMISSHSFDAKFILDF